jgi:hypothetical protein
MDHLASAVLPTLGCVPDDPWAFMQSVLTTY